MITRLLFVLRRRWPILVVLPLLCGGVGFLFTPRGDAVRATGYASKALIAVDQAAASPTGVQQALLEAEQGSTASATAEAMGGGVTPGDVSRRVSGSFDDQSFVITFEVTGRNGAEAEKYARAVADTFIEEGNGAPAAKQANLILAASSARDEAKKALDEFLVQNDPILNLPDVPQSVLAERQQLEAALSQAESNLAEIRTQEQPGQIYRLINVQKGGLSTASKLQLPASLALRVSLGIIFGLVGAFVLVALVEKLNPRIDDPEQASTLIGAPVLAMVPVMNRRHRKSIERADPDDFRGPFAEAFRSMRTHLDFRASTEDSGKTPRIMITSATPAEGKSTTTAFLALSYAEAERPPVVVGADLRRPSVHKLFGVERVPGLSSRAASGGATVPLGEIVKTDPVTGVSVVPSGPAIDRVTGLLGDLTAVTAAGQAAGRVVLVDTAPVMVANDATDFLIAVDWVVVVVRVGRSTARSIKQMMQTLNLNEAKVVGVVMVGSLESSDAKRYYYSYYSDDAQAKRSRAKTISVGPSDGTPVPVSGTIESNA
ncbi:hypothetical protein BH10ACT1_BH10ACT1_07940 [soil metagenome]